MSRCLSCSHCRHDICVHPASMLSFEDQLPADGCHLYHRDTIPPTWQPPRMPELPAPGAQDALDIALTRIRAEHAPRVWTHLERSHRDA